MPGSLITPGFGGRGYFPTAKGFITMQVMLGESKWFMPYHGYIGAGSSNTTWQALLGVGYRFAWGDAVRVGARCFLAGVGRGPAARGRCAGGCSSSGNE